MYHTAWRNIHNASRRVQLYKVALTHSCLSVGYCCLKWQLPESRGVSAQLPQPEPQHVTQCRLQPQAQPLESPTHLRITLLLPRGAVLICSSQCLGISTCPAASSAATLSSSVDDRLTVAAPLKRPPWNRLCKPELLPPLLLALLSSTRLALLLLPPSLPLLPAPPNA